MPIHLPPVSRRNFLKRSLLAGASFALAPQLFAARRRANPNSWALFADTHIAADTTKIARGINMAEHFRTAAKDVRSLPERPAALFLTGDCAFNSGEADDYFQLAGLLGQLRGEGFPLHIALGNHDHREHFWAGLPPEDAAQRAVTDRQVALIKAANVNWFLLDSLETTLQTPGLLGENQLAWLAKSLDANPSKPAIVLVHHNPGTRENIGGLKDTDALLGIIRQRRQVKAWVFGHTHTWRTDQDESGLHLINLPPVAYVFRANDPAGWVHATTHRDGLKLELRCINAAHQNHGQVVELKWRNS
jgi:3',5'-cyclic AMP phosphodiesterase CpdA